MNYFSRKLYSIEHGTPLKAAEKPNRKRNLSFYRRNDIRNVEKFTPRL